MKIKFCGAAKTVTGSCYLMEASGRKFLIDCGMFQGKMEHLNSLDFPFNPAEIDFMILTHAHIDHSGRIPILMKHGFKGTVYCTSATAELAAVMLRDSGHIHEMEAQWDNKKRARKGMEPVEPLYTPDDADYAAQFFYPVAYDEEEIVDENIRFTLRDAGHLLGSAIVCLKITENGKTSTITFTGDLGNHHIPIIREYEYIDGTDYLITESTYGNRIHEVQNETDNLYDMITRTIDRGGNVIIPSFAVGRAQEILYMLDYYIEIEKKKKLKDIDIYLDSPLAVHASEIFAKHKECYNTETLKELQVEISPIYFPNLKIIKSPQESMELNGKNGVVIISSSGMCEAGRIKHHLKHNIWRKDSSIIFVGYQAEGTLGRRILDGAKRVNIFGEEIVVKAEIDVIHSLSGHADLNGILNWVSHIKHGVNKTIFITHGDMDAIENLQNELHKISDAKTIVPDMYDEIDL